ncbi:MAG: amidohydrolase [Acidobacteria bacterium]|uniref:Amidohydrolase n=1 Tax=Candidatus Polarisedimenticola svalbardensis TaxID=2886004 RepID=A0A8J6XTY6_9BACT|nr:amidohydrolase [Candidatus Polarisedimenticola svalbardensis]
MPAQALTERIIGWRRSLHKIPELGFQEHQTSAFVESRLREIGLTEIRTGVARTGVVATIRAGAGGNDGAVLLRADMDALPVQEVEGREYGSETPGKMHACGHDGHMAMLLGAATLLHERKDSLKQDVVLCFQPAEEGAGGGREMVEGGELDLTGVSRAFAIHLWSLYPAGTVHTRPGPIMAAQDEFTAWFRGRGGHGAAPHNARDPIVAASLGVVALQTVVSRFVDPLSPAVATVGSMHGGSACNIIPEVTELIGTLRSFDPDVRLLLRHRVEEAFAGAARSAGCELEFEVRPGYPAVVNDAESATIAGSVAGRLFGKEKVFETPPLAASEDFAYFLQKVPGAFILLGAGNEERGITAPHHSPQFDIDESALPKGAELLAALAME